MPRTTSTVIRLARLRDANTIANLSRSQVEQGLPWRWRPGRVQHQIRAIDATVIVAQTKGRISGFAIAGFSETSAHVSLLAVDPGFRRQGIATDLLRWIEESCKVAGIARINLEVRNDNLDAISFYQNLGFQSAGIRQGYYEGLLDARLMTLELIPAHMEKKRPS